MFVPNLTDMDYRVLHAEVTTRLILVLSFTVTLDAVCVLPSQTATAEEVLIGVVCVTLDTDTYIFGAIDFGVW